MAGTQAHPVGERSAAGVVIGVDAHRGSHTAVVLDAQQQVLAEVQVPADREGYRRLRRWAARWLQRCWAVENAAGTGRLLSQWLLGDGERVLDVPAKLSARVRLLSVGHGRKSDRADARSTALAAWGSVPLRPAAAEDATTALRLLVARREDLVARRTQVTNRLRALLVELGAGPLPGTLSAARARQTLARVRARTAVAQVRRALAEDLLHEWAQVQAALAALEPRIAQAVAVSGSTLPTLFGLGSVLAATILGHVGDIRRFPSAGHFAAYCGVAPLEASSGGVVRHRLSRAGDRQLNRALHLMATCQARAHPQGRAYYRRKRAEGRSHLEALRCLKRRLADVVYRQLRRDALATTASPACSTAPTAQPTAHAQPAAVPVDRWAGGTAVHPSTGHPPHHLPTP